MVANWDDPGYGDGPPEVEFRAAMLAAIARHIAFADQAGALSRTRRTQIMCGRCNGPHLLAGADAEPDGDCGCERPCERAGCLAPDEGLLGDVMVVPDVLP